MDHLELVVETGAQQRAQPLDVAGRQAVEPGIVRLRLDDRIEIAAIGDVDHQLAELRTVDVHLVQREVARDVGEADPLDEAPLALIVGDHEAGRRIEPERAFGLRADEALLEREGHRADRAVAAHRQASRHLDIEDADVAVVATGRVEDRARHDVVAARLEHQGGADPVQAREKILAPRAHGGAAQAAARRPRPAAPDCRRYGRRCRRRCARSLRTAPFAAAEPQHGTASPPSGRRISTALCRARLASSGLRAGSTTAFAFHDAGVDTSQESDRSRSSHGCTGPRWACYHCISRHHLDQ